MLLNNFFGGNAYSSSANAASGLYNFVVPAHRQGRSRVTKFSWTPGATSHTLTAMRPLATSVFTTADAAASQAVIVLSADPGAGIANAIAANDLLVIRQNDGSFTSHKVSSVSGLSITLTANLSKVLSAGAEVWFYGVIGDTDPALTVAHPTYALPTGSTTSLTGDTNFVISSHDKNQPILLQVDNATNVGTAREVVWVHTLN